ncbi:MAG: arginine repressor [Chlorobiaceae bacterium]
MNKHERQQKIIELLHHHHVGNQHDLLQLLRSSGMTLAQATLSRDCSELGIIRWRTNGRYRMTVADDNTGKIIKGLVGLEVLEVKSNETSVIITTLPGRAHGVGSYLDQLKNPLILGTIAGDDTVLVIPASVQNISAVISYIQKNLFKN